MPSDGGARGRRGTLDRRFARAVTWASDLHDSQVKKGTDTPYVAHLLAVAALVLEGGGNQTEAIAALLHGSLEDTAATRKQIRKRFGKKVARIVAECTEVPTGRDRKKRSAPARDATTWWERKRHTVEVLGDPATSASAVRVRAADALATARAVLADLRRFGPEAWSRFNAGAVDQLWYYRSLSLAVSARLPGLLSDELRVTVSDLERLSGWWFDVGDPQPGH